LIEEILPEAKITLAQLNQLHLPPIHTISEMTFGHLKLLQQKYPQVFRRYYAIGTKIKPNPIKPENTFEMVVFSHKTFPQMPLWEATRISMSLPFYFKPIILDGIPHVDGGLLYNYAINIFDKGNVANYETLGLRVDKPAEIAKFLDQKLVVQTPAQTFKQKYSHFPTFDDFSKLIGDSFLNSIALYKTTRTDDGRSVYINTGSVGTTDFDIKKEHRDGLINYGIDWCETFFSWWDSAYLKNPKPTGPLEEAATHNPQRVPAIQS